MLDIIDHEVSEARPASRLLLALGSGLLLLMIALGLASASANSSSINNEGVTKSTGAWIGSPEMGMARLVSAVDGTGQLAHLPLGLEFRLAPGWKVYWRTPGEAGLPPSLSLQINGAPLVTDISWPVPQRFDAFGFDNFGYADNVIYPLSVSGHSPGTAVQISGSLEALVCAQLCVPLGGDLYLNIADGPANPSAMAQPIAKFAAQVPRDNGASSIAINRVWQEDNQLMVRLATNSPPVTEIFVESLLDNDGGDYLAGLAFKQPSYANGLARIDIEGGPHRDLAGTKLRLTIVADTQFASRTVIVSNKPATSNIGTGNGTGNGNLLAILLAFLGGLILNLMPCVLPVLAIKLASIIDASGQQRGFVRLRFSVGAAGIITSFMMLAAGLALVRLAGGQVGWGVQFQSPVFLGVMLVVVGLFMLMMLDRLHLPIPQFVQRASGARQKGPAGVKATLAGDFTAGMLATLLATPCSAPFVGGAVTLALTGSYSQLFAIFMAMGSGLAAPWILVAIFPGIAGWLPRPGRWMIWMKRGLAGLLAVTVIWLGYLLLQSLGLGPQPADRLGSGSDKAIWQIWTPQATNIAQSAGKTVLVDVTADWCITCKANKTLVLDLEPVAGRLAALRQTGDLVMLQADWTRPNQQIADFLASHGRFGIPFNIIYGPGAPDGLILGELLTAQSVLDAVAQASGKP